MSEVVNNPTMFAAVILMGLVMVFTLVAGLCAAGGAIGAKYGPPPGTPHPEPRA